MSSVDELFRKPSAVSKRKLEDPTQSFGRSQPAKSAKLANGTSPHRTARTQPPPATVEDEAPEPGAEDDDTEAGPALPPDEDLEDEDGDDEEGRFFGSGVTDSERQAINILNQNDPTSADADGAETIDLPWLKRTTISFERKINKNAELRAKYADDPMKFVSSEADLDSEIKTLSLLSEYPSLYPDLVKSGSLASLVSLLAHDNTDIAISAVQVLEELTDEDTSATPEQWTTLSKALLKADVIDLLVSNLSRLNETTTDNDRDGVYHILSVLENLLSSPTNHDTIGANEALLAYLLKRIQTPDPSFRASISQNRQYAGELLAILLQASSKNRTRIATQDGLETILQLLAPYRNHDPEHDGDEEEFVENLFDCLTCLVEDQTPAQKFLDAEGVELCLIMLREGKLSKSRALKVLDHAMSGAAAVAMCDRVVEAAGLKTLFGVLMKTKEKGKEKKRQNRAAIDREGVEHLLGILASLLRYTPAESPARIRSLAKFVEKEYEKIVRLVELRQEYKARVRRVDTELEAERKTATAEELEELEDEWLSRRLDAGLASLQTLDVVLSWLVAEDSGARKRIESLLGDDGGTAVLKKSLEEQLEGIDADTEKAKDGRDMLEALIRCL